MIILGIKCLSCARGRILGFRELHTTDPKAWSKIAEDFEEINLEYYCHKTKKMHPFRFPDFWNGLLNERCLGNICDRIPHETSGMLLIPPIIFNDTVVYATKQLMGKENLEEECKNWFKKTKNYMVSDCMVNTQTLTLTLTLTLTIV